MGKYNFKPDYKKWWNKKSLNHDDLCWLLVGVNPDDVTKAIEIQSRESTHEDKQWLAHFNNQLGPFTKEQRANFKQLLQWKNDKRAFVKDAYEAYAKFPQEFLDLLLSEGALIQNIQLEQYKDHTQYAFDFDNLLLENITTEDQALAFLLGLQYDYFQQFITLEERQDSEPKDDRGFSAYSRFRPEERWFYSEYSAFLQKQYYDLTAISMVTRAVKTAKSFKFWNGSFSDYVQNLYNEGFIFKREVNEQLAKLGIQLQYDENSWAIKFYKYWLNQGGWTLEEAVELFKGQDPRDKKRSFIDLSQNPWILSYSVYCLSWDEFEHGFIDLSERLFRHVSTEAITAYKHKDDQLLYRPSDIVAWLENHTLYLPSKALLMTIGHDTLAKYEEHEQEKIEQNKKTPEHMEHNIKLKEAVDNMYKLALSYWHEYITKNGAEPTKQLTAEYLASHYNNKWEASSIERELSGQKLKLNYQDYVKTIGSQ